MLIRRVPIMHRMYRMCLLAAAICVPSASCETAERIRMIGPSAGEEAAKSLMQSLAECCNNRDCDSFLTHFTASKAASIRKTMRELFEKHDLEMEIKEVSVVSESEDMIVFDLQYGWRDKRAAPQVLHSQVIAAKTKNGWKIDSEKVKRAEVQSPPAEQFDFGGGGQVVLNPNDDLLPSDIAKRPGGCVGGRCGAGK